jgi:hypothetical protein
MRACLDALACLVALPMRACLFALLMRGSFLSRAAWPAVLSRAALAGPVIAAMVLAGPLPAAGPELPAGLLPPGIAPGQVLGVSPSFEARPQDLLDGHGADILRDLYPDYVPLPNARDGGIWFGTPGGAPGSNDYGQISFVYVDIDGEIVCIQVSSQDRLDRYFPILPAPGN